MIYLLIVLLLYFLLAYPLVIYYDKILQNKYYVELNIGNIGTGKTADIIKQSIKSSKSGEFDQIYTTIDCPNSYKFNFEDLSKGFTFKPNSDVYIDEIGILFSNREFKTNSKAIIDWMKLCRHYQCRIHLYSQDADTDKKLRMIVSQVWKMDRFGVWTIKRRISKSIDLSTDEEGNGRLVESYKMASIIGGIKINYLPRYINLWDTYERKKLPIIPNKFIYPQPLYNFAYYFKKWYKHNFGVVYSRLQKVWNTLRTRIDGINKTTIFVPDLDFALNSYWYS